jgi:hypothetical protein
MWRSPSSETIRDAVYSFVLYCFLNDSGNILDNIASNSSMILTTGKLGRIWKEAAGL